MGVKYILLLHPKQDEPQGRIHVQFYRCIAVKTTTITKTDQLLWTVDELDNVSLRRAVHKHDESYNTPKPYSNITNFRVFN